MILAGLAYRDVGQPRFFLFPGNAEAVVSGSTRGASPACPCKAGTTAFGNRTRSQPRQRGCSRGLGCYPNKQKQRFPASPGTAVSSLCGNKDIACQVAHPRKIPCRNSFVLWQAAVWQERFCGDPGWAYRRRSGRRPRVGVVLAAALGHQHHFCFLSSGAGGVLHKIAGNE